MKNNIFISNLRKSSVILTAVLVISGFFVASFALAIIDATITPASGGSNISIDTTSAEGRSGEYTTLSGPTITENAPGQIFAGIHIITLPDGWEFDTSLILNVNASQGSGILPKSQVAVIAENTLTFTIVNSSTEKGTLTFISDMQSNSIKVRPTGITISEGNMTYSGAGIAGVNETTNFGTLSTVAGIVTQLAFTTEPGSVEYGSVLNPQPVVVTQDQFGNNSTSGLATNLDVVITKTSGTGVLIGVDTFDIGTEEDNGIVTFTDLTVNEFGMGKQLTASAEGLTSAISDEFEITKKALTITADDNTKVYGEANPVLTERYEGFIISEDESVLDTPTILNVLADEASPVGEYDIIASAATAINYEITFIDGTLTVTQAPLTITADVQTKVYGQNDPALTYITIPDPLLNEDVLNGSFFRDAGENVGIYAITQGNLNNSNYDITFVSANLIITQKALTVTAVTDTKIYDGDITSDETPTITGSLVSGDTADFIQTYDDKNVGETKTLTPSGIVNDGNSGDNYSYNFVNDLTGIITPAPLIITAEAKTKVYGGVNPELTASYIGLVGDDTSTVASGLLIETVADSTTPVGPIAITLSGATATNYSISFVDGILTITQAPLTITANAQEKVYGELDLTFTYISEGLINGDTLSGFLSRTEGENAGTYAITQGELDNSNYDITFVSANLIITQKALTVTAVTDAKVYDGTTDSTEIPTIAEELAFEDTADFIQTYDDKNVGENKTLTPSGVVIDGNGGANYSYVYDTDLTGVITQASLTATITVSNKVVDGDNSATITDVELIGVIPNDEVTADFSGATALFDNKNVGNNKDVSASGIAITDADADNYSYDNTATGTGNILPIPTIVYVDDSWAGTTIWTDPDGDSGADYFGYDAFVTIQEGIDAVDSGGTVNVAAGTYDELLTINKDGLTLLGVQTNVDPRPMNGGRSGNESIIQKMYTTETGALNPILIEANNVTINGFTISPHYENTVGDPNGLNKDLVKQESREGTNWVGTTIKYNMLTATGYNIVDNCDELVQLKGVTNAVIEYNYGYHEIAEESGGNAFNIAAGSINSAIRYNEAYRCGDFQYAGKWGGAIYTYESDNINVIGNKVVGGGGITFGASKATNDLTWPPMRNTGGTVSGNIVSGATFGLEIFADSVAVLDNDVSECVGYALNIIGQNVTVQDNNRLYNNGTGILVEDKAIVSSAGVSINENKIYGNTLGLENSAAAAVDATKNYWGTAVLATIQSKIDGPVDYDPYWVNEAMDIPSDLEPDIVYVDDNYIDGNAEGHYFGYNAFATIQEGIDAVEEGGTVDVAAGTYIEAIVINKPLTIKGATYNVNKNGYAVPADYAWNDSIESIIQNPDSDNIATVVDIVSDDVIFEGFIVQSLNRPTNNLGNLLRLDASTGIAHDGNVADDTLDNIIIRNNIIGPNTNISSQDGTMGRMGLYFASPNYPSDERGITNTLVTGNKIFDSKGNGNNVFVWGAAENYLSPIEADYTGTVIQDNEIYGSHRSGIEIAGGVDGLTIQDNKIYENSGLTTDDPILKYGNGIIIIRMGSDKLSATAYGSKNFTIKNNEIYDNEKNGIYMGPINEGHEISGNNIYDNGWDAIQVDLVETYHGGLNPVYDKISNIVANGNKIIGNVNYGVQIIGIPTNGFALDAKENWWGNITGPTHASNTGGTGDAVSDNVNFRPWYLSDALTGLDSVSPTPIISSSVSSPTNLAIIPMTVNFGEAVTGFTLDDITVGNGAKGNFSGSGSTYTFDLTPATDGSVTVDIVAQSAQDTSGNFSGAATQFSITSDQTIPTLTSVSFISSSLIKVGGTITLSFTSDETIQVDPTIIFTSGEVTVTDAVTVTNTGSNNWTATYVASVSDTDGAVAFTIDFTDIAGNNGAQVTDVTNASSVTFDKTAPVVPTIISIADDNYINDLEKATIVVTGTVEVNALVNATLSDGTTTLTTVTQQLTGEATEYSITLDGTALVDGVITPSVTATDAAGNESIAATTPTAVKDVIVPTVVSHVPTVNAMNVQPDSDIVITFSEAVIVEQGDVIFNPDITGGFVITTSGTEVTINPNNALESNTSYTVILSEVTDLAENVMVTYDNINFTTATYYDISLYFTATGWNLISLPVVPNDTAIATVLGDSAANIEKVWAYDPTNPNADEDSGWLMYAPNDPEATNNLTQMITGYGYWVSVKANTNISGWGSLLTAGPTTPPSRALSSGWNLIGYYQIPGDSSSTSSNAFSSLGNSYTGLWGYDNEGGVFKSTVDPILPGDAFWISLPSEGMYTPSNIQ